MMRLGSLGVLVLASLLTGSAWAEASFDLAGPPLDVRVMREGKTLPISKVPNLQPGDRLWLHPDFPEQQEAKYLLITTFLRGATNPPPDGWFTKAETWSPKVRDEGIFITVPKNAEQALLFLAPDTGGGFSTLRSNVRGRPGSFVRASQDLNQASLDRSRLDMYLASVRRISEKEPQQLQKKSKVLAQSLNIRLDDSCFQRPEIEQLACLTRNQDNLVMDDGHTQSMVAALTSGASADLIGQVSATRMAGGGMYSAYVGAVVDLVRIMNSIHTAKYQYIPALAEPRSDEMELKLNNVPSFTNPKSVLTVSLPAVEKEKLPPLRAANPDQVFCAQAPQLILPVEGAPLVYSTHLAHDFVLHIPGKSGQGVDLPAKADPAEGGFVVDTQGVQIASLEPEMTGILRGYWGFQPFNGPSFHLRSTQAKWTLLDGGKGALITGQEDAVHLDSTGAVCVDNVQVRDQQGQLRPASYRLVKPGELEVKLPLEDMKPGMVTLLLQQAGRTAPAEVPVHTYAVAAHLNQLTYYSGDQEAVLEGSRLDQVSKLELKGVDFTPVPESLKHSGGKDELTLKAAPVAGALKPGARLTAHVFLKDGRTMILPVTVLPPRPRVTMISRNVEMGQAAPSPIRLANKDELPQDATLTFVLQTQSPAIWPRTEKVEVATEDGAFHVTLNVEDGSLTLQDANTVLAVLNPLKSFGPSAFGPLRFRAITADGAMGDWQPLGNLVRIPTLTNVQCPANPGKRCTLNGSNLFLLDSVAADSGFKYSVPVPVGFANTSLQVPRPVGTLLYLKLRDDPSAVNVVSLPVLPDPQQ